MDALTRRAFGGLLHFQIVAGILLFLPAWTLRYWQAWVFWALFGISTAAISLHFLRNDRHLIEGRINAGPAAESRPSQKIIQSAAAALLCASFVAPGFDHRYHWSPVPTAVVLVGDGIVVLSLLAIFFVFRANTNTFATVKVEPGQRVISTGPYGVVRHPMYLAAVFLFLGIPLALGSFWTLLVAIPLCGVLVVRLLDEERYLAANLPGYTAYCQKVRFRLIPLVW